MHVPFGNLLANVYPFTTATIPRQGMYEKAA